MKTKFIAVVLSLSFITSVSAQQADLSRLLLGLSNSPEAQIVAVGLVAIDTLTDQSMAPHNPPSPLGETDAYCSEEEQICYNITQTEIEGSFDLGESVDFPEIDQVCEE